ncbi:MerR family transcriptional regulator [Stappia sp. GBMRC 2046]|uniref:MerR family transcriptional regulator n=1 Tax=Stappia sediminis TaxID=2692190 RepID=A0A7X3LYB1_9HYPH|nr:MerR family transcriptional regulator [Stappia sediminis]MXN67316.1 MerR family transcriptional regulator [Stappia sediminis]
MSTDKSPDAFRTISEVADSLDLPQHVLRFWETRFVQIRPLKRGGGRRYYRPDDVELLRGIRHLLYNEGYTIKGVQRILKEQGPRFVMQIWQEDAISVPVAAVAPAGAGEGSGQRYEAPEDDRAYRSPRAGKADDAEMGESDRHDAQNVDGEEEAAPRDVLVGEEEGGQRGGLRFMDRLWRERPDPQPGGQLSKDDIRRMQATLFELLECKRILDQAR